MNPASFCYEYPRPAVSADIVVFAIRESRLRVLLIERARDPFKGKWALPGGFLEMDESIESCAQRELQEETSLTGLQLEQFYTFSAVERDPRGRVLTVAFWTVISKDWDKVKAGDDAANAGWYDFNELPGLAFDHSEIIAKAYALLKAIVFQKHTKFEIDISLLEKLNLS